MEVKCSNCIFRETESIFIRKIFKKPFWQSICKKAFLIKVKVVSIPGVEEQYYFLKDHLGSIRVTIDESGNRVAAQDYYPYGEILRQYNNSTPLDKYKFTEKERDAETNLDYFGARYYNSKIGLWLSVDPMAVNYPSNSPYGYCLNNPLKIIDPDGMDTLYFNADGSYTGECDQDETGNYYAYVRDKDGNIIGRYSFLDAQDAISIRDNIPNRDNFMLSGLMLDFEKYIDSFLKNSGVKDRIGIFNTREEKFIYAAIQSQENGSMDYASHFKDKLEQEMNRKVAIINGVAYNNFDAGNYLWGAGMKELGFNYITTQTGSQLFAIMKYGKPDQKEDQIAIYNGYHRK